MSIIKKVSIAAALVVASIVGAEAQTAVGTGVGIGQAASQSGAVASNVFNSPGSIRTHQSGSLKTTPSVAVGSLGNAGIESCVGGGVSAGGSVTGFGLGFSKSDFDASCNRRLNARTLFNFGYKTQALAIMMNEPEVAQAFGAGPAVAGRPNSVVYPASAPVEVIQTQRARPVAAAADQLSLPPNLRIGPVH